MATPAQSEANRRNALKSTGPKTDEGKAISRANALKHGLAGEGVAMTVEAKVERREEWGRAYKIESEEAGWTLDRWVAASLQVERCEEAIDGIFASDPERARLAWDADKEAECAVAFARIAKSPGAVVARLKGSLHGVGLLIRTWNLLGDALADGGEWTEAEASLALDLLMVPPACRDGRTAIDGPNGGDRDDHRREIVRKQIDKLEATVEEVGELDLLDRKLAMAGLATLTSPRAQLVLRYEREAWRRFREARKALEPLKIPADERATPRPAAPVAPAPRVEARPIVATRPAPAASPETARRETKPISRAFAHLPARDAWLDDLNAPPAALDFRVGTPRRGV